MFDTTDLELIRTRTDDGVLLHGAMRRGASPIGILAVHGAWGNFYGTPVFDLLRSPLLDGHTVLSINGRGHDLGSLGDGEECIGMIREIFEDCVTDLDAAVAVLGDLGIDDYVVVAHSYGAHRAAYWLATTHPSGARAVAMLSPGPALSTAAGTFVEGRLEDHIAAAQEAVSAGRPEQLIVISSSAPVPMVAEAATVLSVWGPDNLADAVRFMPEIDIPTLVTVGAREPTPYRDKARHVAEAGSDIRFVELADNHYYTSDRDHLIATVFEWITHLGLDPKSGT
ncbi:MAG: alpha/beta fold hydrolase [Microthrixaceae bacterium]